MTIEVTQEDLAALSDKLVVVKPVTQVDGTQLTWVKGALEDILDYFIPEGSFVARFVGAEPEEKYDPVTWGSD